MPDLSSITVSLDTARKLAEAGFPQETVLYHIGPYEYGTATFVGGVRPYGASRGPVLCAAPTLGELWADLPESIGYAGGVYDLVHVKGGGAERMGYLTPDDKVLQPRQNGIAAERLWSEGEVAEDVAAVLWIACVASGHLVAQP